MSDEPCDDDGVLTVQTPRPAPVQRDESEMRQVSDETSSEESLEESKSDLAILRSLQNIIEEPGIELRRRRRLSAR